MPNVLEKVDEIKDLGILFDPYLLFDSYVSEKVSKAYMMLGIIKRNFIAAMEYYLLHLYKTSCRIYEPRGLQRVDKLESSKERVKAMKIIIRRKN